MLHLQTGDDNLNKCSDVKGGEINNNNSNSNKKSLPNDD